jgi:hypothetical protein
LGILIMGMFLLVRDGKREHGSHLAAPRC